MKPSTGTSWLRWFIASMIMLAAMGYLFVFSGNEAVPSRIPLSSFPSVIGTWKGTESHFDQRVYDVLGVDDSILMNYLSPGSNYIQLYVGYYQSQREGDLIHSPKNCLPGAGWLITRTSIENLIVPGNPQRNIDVIRLLMEKDGAKQVVLYWFQSRGRFIASEYLQKIYMVWDSLTKHRTDEAFVRLITPVGPEGETSTTEYLKKFAGQLIPVLETYLPGKDI